MKLFLSPVILASGLMVIGRDAGPREPRPLSAPFTLCAGGDVTLGTNLDPVWARYAADTLQNVAQTRCIVGTAAKVIKPELNPRTDKELARL